MSDAVSARDDDRRSRIGVALERGVDRALSVQQPAIERLSRQMGAKNPDISPTEAVAALDRYYRHSLAGFGAVAGASAFVPAIGTAAGVAINVAEIGVYLETTMLYCMTLAEIYDVQVVDLDRRRTLLFAILLGDSGAKAVQKASQRVGKHWGKKIVTAIPITTVRQLNKKLAPNFITKYGTTQGILVLGRELPFGIGAAVGGAGNYALARATIKAARHAFGPPPTAWPDVTKP